MIDLDAGDLDREKSRLTMEKLADHDDRLLEQLRGDIPPHA